MLGITPRLLSRPLGCCHTTQVLRTVTTPYKHDFLRYNAFRTVGSAGYNSKVAGDNESGHIEARENEGMLFVDSKSYKGSWFLARVYRMLELMVVGLPSLLLLECWGLPLQYELILRRYLPSEAQHRYVASLH